MSHLNPGLLSAYNSLTDKHLAGYFSNTRIRRHLQRAGLITRSGRIVPDKEYRHKLIQRAHQRRVRECLAQAIFHKVLEMERLHQIEIKRKLEEFARRERVHKIKVERSKRYEEDIIRILSPRPPIGARGIRKQHSGPEGEHSESSESPGSSRPNTAPGKMQRPVRLKPINSNSTTASVRRSSPYRLPDSSHENTMDRESRRRLTPMEASHGISPYCLPVINNFVTPVPPATKRREGGVKVSNSSTIRGRRLRPTTATSGVDVSEDLPMLRSSVHQSRVRVNMVYFGKTVHLSHDLTDLRDEIKVFQQHCGGENLCVYKGKLHEGETFQFISRRHRGFPFSLTFFLNGLQVERLSSCCEFKHRKGSRLGGRHGHFGFSSVEGASPCYKCIIAMGLDKKPTPPPKRVKEDGGSPKDAPEMETERTGDAASHSECETSQPQDMETQVKAEPAPEEDKVRDDYEEDFEADDEGPAEDTEAEQRKSLSRTIETEKQVNEKDASESEDEEKDEDIRSRSGSSSSGSDQEETDAEVKKEDEKTEQPKDVDQEETVPPPDEKDEPNPEEAAAATEGNSAVTKDADMQDSAGDSTEIEISDTNLPSGNENRQSEDTSADKDTEKTLEESKEQERAKSVQEKLAEAILKESQCSSEPELSDTSTEEEESSAKKEPKQDNKDDVQETILTLTLQEQSPAEENKCKESIPGEGEVAHEQEESEQKEETEPHENSTKDEINEVQVAAQAAEENSTSEDTEEVQHPVNEDVAQGDESTDLPEEPKSTDAERDGTEEEKSAIETDIQPDETGQGAKTREEDESSISELNKKTDEPAVADNAEAEALAACETMEIKAESSEEREALSCEEAPDAEKRQQADSKESPAASETENTAEDSSSSPEGSGDTTVEKTDVRSEEKDESNKDDIKEEEQASHAEESKDDSQQEQCELGEERAEKSEEVDETVEKQKPEEEGEKQTHMNPDKMAEDEKEGESDEKDQTEEEHTHESKVDESRESKENTAEETDTNTGKIEEEKEAEKNLTEETNEEKNDNPAETDENREHVEINDDDKESEVREGEERGETNTEKDDEAETSEKDENRAEQSQDTGTKNDEESEERRDVTEGEEISEHTEEPEKSADEEKETVKASSAAEAAEVGGSEAADCTEENNMTESEKEKETETQKVTSDNGEVDAENGEPLDDKGEAPPEDTNDQKAAENGEEERRTEESTEEFTGESGDTHKDDKVDPDPNTDVTESDAKGEKQEGSIKNDSEPETSGAEIKGEPKLDDRKDSEATGKDENGNKFEENGESDLIENNIQNIASSGEQTSAPLAADLDDAANRLDEDKTDKHPHSENTLGADPADGENGADTEEASKASEEGASVLLKPQAQNKEADNTEQSVVEGNRTPEALASEDNSDLVTNWVNVHQSSKFFETFIEPLEDLKEETSDTEVSSPVKEETTELQQRSEMLRKSEDEEKAHETKAEAVEPELYSTHAEDEPAAKETEREEEESEVEALIPKTETEPNDSANGLEGSRVSLQEDKNQQEISEEENVVVSKTELESASWTHHSASESVSEKHAAADVVDLNINQPNAEDPLSSMNTEGPQSESPDRLKDADETGEKPDEHSRDVTDITDFTTSKSDEVSQEESHSGEIQSKASDRMDVQLIQDIKHTLSKERLSTFSVDETLFGPSSYPLLTAARAESGH